MRFEISRTISADHPSLAGHFPDVPIVPGVVILDEVVAALMERCENCQLAGIPAVKFVLPLKPEQQFTICVAAINDARTEFKFACSVKERPIAEGCLEIVWNGSNRSTATSSTLPFNPPPSDPRLTHWLQHYPSSLFNQRLYQSIELMEYYSVDLAIDVLCRLNVLDQLRGWRSAGELCGELSFQSHFSSAMDWLLRRLIETGCIEVQPKRDSQPAYRLRHAPRSPQLAALRAAGLDIDRTNSAALDLLDHAASLYPAVARGEQNGEQGLLGTQAISLWLNYFHNNNLTYSVNNWVSAILASERVANRPKLRILEVGAGAGSASEILLRCFGQRGLLPRIERYLITEPSAFFRRRGQRELSAEYRRLPIEWAALDINIPWEAQGAAHGEFDLIFGVNVLHVARDLLFSLSQARDALSPDGWFVIGECVRPHPDQPIYAELIFQILESFTNVNLDPEIRPNAGFLTADQWRRAFTRAGFQQIEIAPELDRIREFYSHFFTGAIAGQRAAVNA